LLIPFPFPYESPVGDCVGTDIIAAAFLLFAAEFFTTIKQAPTMSAIFFKILEAVIFFIALGQSTPSFQHFGYKKKPSVTLMEYQLNRGLLY
jgi:hypothetical protein